MDIKRKIIVIGIANINLSLLEKSLTDESFEVSIVKTINFDMISIENIEPDFYDSKTV